MKAKYLLVFPGYMAVWAGAGACGVTGWHWAAVCLGLLWVDICSFITAKEPR